MLILQKAYTAAAGLQHTGTSAAAGIEPIRQLQHELRTVFCWLQQRTAYNAAEAMVSQPTPTATVFLKMNFGEIVK